MTIRGIPTAGTITRGRVALAQSRPPQGNQPRFGNGFANWLVKTMPNAPNMVKGGLSLEDWAARSSLLASVYVPQGILALWERQGPIETWSRNIMTFIGGIAITIFAKHPTFGFNALANQFMFPKERLKALPKSLSEKLSFFMKRPKALVRYAVNALRPTYNYLELFKEAGLNLKKLGYSGGHTAQEMLKVMKNKTFWTALDVNQKQMLINYTPKASLIKALLKRITACKILSVIGSGILMTVLTGIGVQLLVFSIFAPMDRIFTPKSETRKKKFDPYPLPPAAAVDLRQRAIAFAGSQSSGGPAR